MLVVGDCTRVWKGDQNVVAESIVNTGDAIPK
jgi:hypothetical protein